MITPAEIKELQGLLERAGPLEAPLTLHRQPDDCTADIEYSIFSGDDVLALVSVAGQQGTRRDLEVWIAAANALPTLLSNLQAARKALEEGATYLDEMEANLLANNADMFIDPVDPPSEMAKKLRRALGGEP